MVCSAWARRENSVYTQQCHEGISLEAIVSIRYGSPMQNTLEPPDQYISIARASVIAGLSPHTLRVQVRAKKLHAVKLGHDLATTRQWLHTYLLSRDDTNTHAAPLPEGYVPPEA